MLFKLLTPLADYISAFNLLKYITFRIGAAAVTSLLLSFLLGPPLIRFLRKTQSEGQPFRLHGPNHTHKRGTPTMGGLLILSTLFLSSFLWSDCSDPFVAIALSVTAALGLLGAHDDFLKLKHRSSERGVSAFRKLLIQFGIAFSAGWLLEGYLPEAFRTDLPIPYFKDLWVPLGILWLPFAATVVVASSNAVNLTDGLDGLAIGTVAIVGGCFTLLAYVVGHASFSSYLFLPHIPQTAELSVLLGALVGSSLGFLWYNISPAQIFMGDVGSLSLGGLLGTIAVMIKHEIILGIIGGIFVLESLSVLMQVSFFKITKKRWGIGKRIFLMAPLHHHFEKRGWSETQVVTRFWILAILFALLGLASLKIR